MATVLIILKIIIAIGIYNVWLLRYGKASGWRGGNAQNMKEEFEVYGLPGWSVAIVGALKIICATLLIAGIWFPVFTQPAALGIAVLMLGAIAMHVKVKDSPQKSLPAFSMLVLSL